MSDAVLPSPMASPTNVQNIFLKKSLIIDSIVLPAIAERAKNVRVDQRFTGKRKKINENRSTTNTSPKFIHNFEIVS
jgi:hypothetical protein